MKNTRDCLKCNRTLPYDMFQRGRTGNPISPCKACKAKKRKELTSTAEWKEHSKLYQQKYYKEGPQTSKYEDPLIRESSSGKKYSARRMRTLKYDFGLTLDAYEKLMKSQDYSCFICGTAIGDKLPNENRVYSRACVDHCHISGEVCKILCHGCNSGIGQFNENSDTIQKALDYVKQFKTAKV